MPKVETVKGTIESSKLGVTLMHEHVFVLSTEIMENFPATWGDEDKRIERSYHAAQRAEVARRRYNRGPDRHRARPLHPAHPTSSRRNRFEHHCSNRRLHLQRRARCTSTFKDLEPRSDGPELMTDMFVKDIEEGIAGTGVKAAILKCATDEPGVTPGVERVLRAVAAAHRRTGVPISTHTHATHRGGARTAAHFQRRRCGSLPRGHRAFGRHDRHRLSGRADRQPARTSAWIASGSMSCCRSRIASTRSLTLCERGHAGQDGFVARRRLL